MSDRVIISQPWERSYTTEPDEHFTFALPKDHQTFLRVAWDDRKLEPMVVKELDELRGLRWQGLAGTPLVWTGGVDRLRTFEIFTIRTDYQQGYDRSEASHGIPRAISGDRSYKTSLAAVVWGWAYTTPGDAQAATGASASFSPTSGASQDWETAYAGSTAYRFTLWHPAVGFTTTEPWESAYSFAGVSLGIFPWERQHSAQNYVDPDQKIHPSGYGKRITKATATASQFATQIWEVEMLAGETTFSQGAKAFTSAWEWETIAAAKIAPALGGIRAIVSPDRQYLPVLMGVPSARANEGTIRDWRSSSLSVMVWQAVTPAGDLSEQDEVDLIPAQMLKYIRYFVWSRAFGRHGEGYKPDLAEHYDMRFKRGIQIFRRISDLSRIDHTYARGDVSIRYRRPPRVKYPPHFERQLA